MWIYLTLFSDSGSWQLVMKSWKLDQEFLVSFSLSVKSEEIGQYKSGVNNSNLMASQNIK